MVEKEVAQGMIPQLKETRELKKHFTLLENLKKKTQKPETKPKNYICTF